MNPSVKPFGDRTLVTYKDVRDVLGVSRPVLYRLVRAGVLVAYKLHARQVVLDVASIMEWMESRRVRPVVRRGRPRTNGPQAARRGA